MMSTRETKAIILLSLSLSISLLSLLLPFLSLSLYPAPVTSLAERRAPPAVCLLSFSRIGYSHPAVP